VKKERLFLIFVSLGLFVACAGQKGVKQSDDEPPNVFAIGRYALATNRFWDLYDHVESIEPGGIKYDSEFRHPYLPLGGLVIDCELTHRIGVTLAVDIPPKNKRIGAFDRYGNSWSKELKVEYHWSHSTAENLARSNYVLPSPLGADNILSDGITLSKNSRVDGVWTVAVTYNDDTIYQTDFRLVGCPSGNSQ